ncbi:MAG: 23S rRNA (adenine(2503)-C(2))-methyltransferase RlmN [Clostridia bacterium]|nr:23S rRNA (adenine(2503)-C(2))-methyltransferase RlmN [Clostridia bacterium]
MEKVALMDFSYEELCAFVVEELGESKFRADQIGQWLYRGAEIEEMKNLSKDLRAKLSDRCIVGGVKIVKTLKSQHDDTQKFLFELRDGELIEGVLMGYHHGHTLCMSTQVGCRMGCAFCASTLDGLVRNLTAGEMLSQIVAVNKELGGGRHVDNIVLMGSGEPFDNYDQVVSMLRRLNEKNSVGIGLRNVSLSTCGLIPGIDRFKKEGLPVTLCLSLHAPNDQIRNKIMPVSCAYNIKDTIAAFARYIDETGRRGIIEYSLISGVNDSVECAAELSRLLRGLRVHVNVIALNPVKERDLNAPTAARVQAFLKELENRHISATRRRLMGEDIEGACGQLRHKTKQEQNA